MSATADTGLTATAVFTTSGAVGQATRRIGPMENSVEDIDMSHLGTTVFKEYLPGDLVEPGEVEVELEFDINALAGNNMPVPGTADTLTVDYPIEPGSSNSTNATLSGTGYFKSRTTPELAVGQLMTSTVVFKFDGLTGPAFTDESA